MVVMDTTVRSHCKDNPDKNYTSVSINISIAGTDAYVLDRKVDILAFLDSIK